MGRIKKMYFAAVCAVIAVTVIFAVFAAGAEDSENVKFLRGLGWSVEERCLESAEIIIPEPFDRVYENYNEIQLESGFDLTPYQGKSGKRYTYRVTNHPLSEKDEVRANVICIDGEIVGGDICTVKIDGFMHGLREKD